MGNGKLAAGPYKSQRVTAVEAQLVMMVVVAGGLQLWYAVSEEVGPD